MRSNGSQELVRRRLSGLVDPASAVPASAPGDDRRGSTPRGPGVPHGPDGDEPDPGTRLDLDPADDLDLGDGLDLGESADTVDAAPGWLADRPAESGRAPYPAGGRDRWSAVRMRIGRRGAIALVVVGLLAAGGAALGVWTDRPVAQSVPPIAVADVLTATPAATPRATPGRDGSGNTTQPAAKPAEIVVSVQGLVHHPGLVRLDDGARIADALRAAGGALPGADLLSLNMAQRLSDGVQILVGVAPTDGQPPRLGSAAVDRQSGVVGADGTAAKGTTAAGPGAAGTVDLNAATADQLDTLPGVGPVTAAAIVAWRDEHGRFTSVDQLADVKGIGPAKLAQLRDRVTV